MPRLVLAFGYKRRRGKDTAATMAKEYLDRVSRACVIDAFAKSLKEGIGMHVLGLSQAQLYGALKEELDPFWGKTPRWMLQHIGTEVMRGHFRDDIWAKTLERRVMAMPDIHFAVADLRFINEVKAIKRLGGVCVHVQRNVEDHPSDFHASETGLDGFTDWDASLDNNGSLDDLRLQVEMLCDTLLEPLLPH